MVPVQFLKALLPMLQLVFAAAGEHGSQPDVGNHVHRLWADPALWQFPEPWTRYIDIIKYHYFLGYQWNMLPGGSRTTSKHAETRSLLVTLRTDLSNLLIYFKALHGLASGYLNLWSLRSLLGPVDSWPFILIFVVQSALYSFLFWPVARIIHLLFITHSL